MIWLFACASPPAPVVAPPAEVKDEKAEKLAAAQKARSEAEAAATALLPAAPTLDRYGLGIGASEHEQVTSWIEAKGLSCQTFPSPTRASFQYRCQGDLPVSLLPDRTITGLLSQILVVRAENAPIHFFASTRKYEQPQEAISDYHGTLDALTTLFGPPKQAVRAKDPESLASAKIVRNAGNWRFRDLDVTVVLLKATSAALTVQETWQVPGAEARIATHDRTGSLTPGKKPPGWNPHVSSSPTLE